MTEDALIRDTGVSGAFDEELSSIFSIVKAATGHDFSSYKVSTVARRIERRMAVNEVTEIKRYLGLLEENPHEPHALSQDILIGVTSFFRDPEAFENLRKEVVPRLFEGRSAGEPVRIWHACCASGEEVYSMAMLIQEYLHEHRIDAKVQFFATDLDEKAISQARSGLYPEEAVCNIGEERLQKFFTRIDNRRQVAKSLREMIVFAHHSVIKDPPFSQLDLLVCRNFLIYLNQDMQRRIIGMFHQALKPNAFLFLGSAESASHEPDLFIPIDKKWKLFARRDTKRRPDHRFPLASAARMPGRIRPYGTVAAEELNPAALAEKLLVERYSPPCVVVNSKYEVVHVSTRANRFLEIPVGEPTRDILRMAREELRPPLRAAIYKAFTEQKPVVFRGVRVEGEQGEFFINIEVEPLHTGSAAKAVAMVILDTVSPPLSPFARCGRESQLCVDEASRDMLIGQLEEQLRITHGQLLSVTEQLETSHEGFLATSEELLSINEEYQSANEELQSTNEELETSKEELQSLNEEIVTVNVELQEKVDQLHQANSDLVNLFASSKIATVFLDAKLVIKRFSPAMAAVIKLEPSDIDRPFRPFAEKINWHSLSQDAETVLAGQPFDEREITLPHDDRSYLKRLFPYRTPDGRIDGIVINLIDITRRKQAERSLFRAKEDWERTFDSVPDLIAILDDQHRIVRVNRAMAERLGVTPDACLNQHCFLNMHGTECPPESCPHSMTLRDGHEHRAELHVEHLGADFLVTTTPLLDENWRMIGAVHVARDITELKRSEQALIESRKRLSRAQEIAHLGSWELDLVNNSLYWSDEVYRIFGLEPQQFGASYEAFLEAVHPEDRSAVNAAYSDSVSNGIDTYEIEHRVVRKSDGDIRIVHEKCEHFRDESGHIVRSIGMVQDITERKKSEAALQKSYARIDLMAQTASSLLESASPQSLVDSLCLSVMEFLDCQVFFNFLVDEKAGRLRLNACSGISEDEAKRIEWLDYGVAVCGCAARDACRIVAEDISESLDPRTELVKSYGIQAYACHPLIAYGRVLGTLSFGTGTRSTFNNDELDMMKSVADLVAIAMERKRFEELLQKANNGLEALVKERTDELTSTVDTLQLEIFERVSAQKSLLRLNHLYALLSETNQIIVRAGDRKTLFREFCNAAVDQGCFVLSWIGLLEGQNQHVQMAAACGKTAYLDDIMLAVSDEPHGLGPAGAPVREGGYHVCNDFQNDPCTQPWHERGRAYGIGASASVALKEGGRVVGALTLYAGEKGFFDKQAVELLLQIGADISFALDNFCLEARRREMEQALQNETLERLRAVEALREKEQLLIQQSRLAAMGEMIGNIAHQWRQPLNLLAMKIQQMQMYYENGLFSDEYMNETVAKSMQQIRHMSQTIDDFRNFFVPDRERTEFLPNEVIAATLELLRDGFRHQHIELELRLTNSEERMISGFPNEYSQALLNILLNARDALLSNRPAAPRVTVTVTVENGRSVVLVSDNAGGIPDGVMEKIFDPYFTTKGPHEGTGIGLFMSRTIIEKNMQGRLSVRNTEDGAEFRIEV